MQATARDMRFHTGALLDTVARGEEVTITFRGRAKAKLIPVRGKGETETAEAFGMWRDRADIADPSEYVRKVRRGRFGC